MNNKEADAIIKNYKPHNGFFDLSAKPDGLQKIEYAKVLNLQNFLSEQKEKSEYYKKYDHMQWQKLQEYAAQLQQIVLQYWGDTCFGCAHDRPMSLGKETFSACWHGEPLYGDENSCSGYTVPKFGQLSLFDV